LNAHEVEYLVVGGYAVGVYTEPRTTKDLDVFVRSNEENSSRVFRALAEYGAPLAGMTPDDFNNRPGTIFQIGTPPLRIDILQRIAAVDFDEAWQDRLEGSLDGIPTHVISKEHLIRNKLAVGRKQDILDVENIREADSLL
jgi:hypothetical protein